MPSVPPSPHARHDRERLRRLGFVRIAGVDEVGRGCLAGPVMAGAVVLDPDRHIPGLRDSKLLSPASRERLYGRDHPPRARLGRRRRRARRNRPDQHPPGLAARDADAPCFALAPLPDFVLVDAFRIPDLPMAQRGIVHGDALCSAIAAASIVAKVTRDRLMDRLHETGPALRLRPPQGVRHAGTRPRPVEIRLLSGPPPVVPRPVAASTPWMRWRGLAERPGFDR